eukprot:1844898-Rhodomonas_salina.1
MCIRDRSGSASKERFSTSFLPDSHIPLHLQHIQTAPPVPDHRISVSTPSQSRFGKWFRALEKNLKALHLNPSKFNPSTCTKDTSSSHQHPNTPTHSDSDSDTNLTTPTPTKWEPQDPAVSDQYTVPGPDALVWTCEVDPVQYWGIIHQVISSQHSQERRPHSPQHPTASQSRLRHPFKAEPTSKFLKVVILAALGQLFSLAQTAVFKRMGINLPPSFFGFAPQSQSLVVSSHNSALYSNPTQQHSQFQYHTSQGIYNIPNSSFNNPPCKAQPRILGSHTPNTAEICGTSTVHT